MQSALDMKSNTTKLFGHKDLNYVFSQGEGLDAEDYENDKISIKTVHTGFRHIGEINISEYLQPRIGNPNHEFIEDPTKWSTSEHTMEKSMQM